MVFNLELGEMLVVVFGVMLKNIGNIMVKMENIKEVVNVMVEELSVFVGKEVGR